MSTTLTQGFANLISPSFTACQVALIQQNGVECNGGGYVRQTFGNVSTSSDTANAYISNASQIVYPQATTDIASMTNPVAYVSLYSSSTLIATWHAVKLGDIKLAKPCVNVVDIIIYLR